MRSETWIGAALLAGLLAACGGEANTTGNSGALANSGEPQAAAAAGAAPAVASTIPATRAEVEQAYLCRGVIGGATAARLVMSDGLSPEIEQLDLSVGQWWAARAEQLRAPDMTEAELDALLARSVRVMATPQAINEALPEIRACIEARKAL